MRVRASELADKRVKLVNEMVTGIRVLKLYAWEESLQRRSESVRGDELRHLRGQKLLGSSMGTIAQVQPLAITVATFSLYGVINRGALTAATVITALSVFNQLRGPLGFLPMLVQMAVNIKVSLMRMQRVLIEPELPPFATERGADTATEEEQAAATDSTGIASLELGAAPHLPDTRSGAPFPRASPAARVTLRGSFRWPAPKPMEETRTQTRALAGTRKARMRMGSLKMGEEKAGPRQKGGESAALPAPRLAESAAIAQLAMAATNADPAVTLIDLHVDAPVGKLTIICGSVGSGKSSLLSALLGEIPAQLTDGSGDFGYSALDAAVGLRGTMGYFPQSPFILNDTVRGNILLGAPMDGPKYDAVIDACALPPDLKLLPGGDLTQIGEKGVNLSGGQKARIAFARLVYNQHAVSLLDDPLSAVDAHVGRHLFECVLSEEKGLLAGTTRVLVTQQSQFLPHADHVILVDAGRILTSGTYAEVRTSPSGRELLAALQSVGGTAEAAAAASTAGTGPGTGGSALGGGDAQASPSRAPGASANATPEPMRSAAAKRSDGKGAEGAEGAASGAAPGGRGRRRSIHADAGEARRGARGRVLVHAERRSIGGIEWHTYVSYAKAAGGASALLLLLAGCILERGVQIATDYWLAVWIDGGRSSFLPLSGLPPPSDLAFYLPAYAAGLVATCMFTYGRALLVNCWLGLRASRKLYARLAVAVLSARTVFFETTPSGRIVNRFTSDTDMLDNQLVQTIMQLIVVCFSIFGSLLLISLVNPIFIAVLPFLALVYVRAYRLSACAVRDLQRLEMVSKSPVYSHFAEALRGMSTIRAFGVGRRFEAHFEQLLDVSARSKFNRELVAKWVEVRLDLIGAIITTATVLLPVATLHLARVQSSSSATVGLVITYALELSQFLKQATNTTLGLEAGFAAVERILEYVETLPREPSGGADVPGTAEDKPGSAAAAVPWPSAGRVEAVELCVRYRAELPPALIGVTCVIEGGSKVGVVGRTGSGKTTFVSALWRLVEPTCGPDGPSAGALLLDGIDISTLSLRALRGRLAIIPQDPVLFHASLRYNLDPFDECSDEELREALALAQLTAAVEKLEKGLAHNVGEGGSYFSAGQRQLVCLARASLRRSRLIALDEATASIDNETDGVLQGAIRQTFASATVLTIAHRLHTIMDSTTIMLFDAGRLAEHAPPVDLLADEASLFAKLVSDTGSASEHLHKLAFDAAKKRDEDAAAALGMLDA